MLNDWDRDKLRQALGGETGDKVAGLLDQIGAAPVTPSAVPPAPAGDEETPVTPSAGKAKAKSGKEAE